MMNPELKCARELKSESEPDFGTLKAVFAGEELGRESNTATVRNTFVLHTPTTLPPISHSLLSFLTLVSCFSTVTFAFGLVFIRRKQDILFIPLLSHRFLFKAHSHPPEFCLVYAFFSFFSHSLPYIRSFAFTASHFLFNLLFYSSSMQHILCTRSLIIQLLCVFHIVAMCCLLPYLFN